MRVVLSLLLFAALARSMKADVVQLDLEVLGAACDGNRAGKYCKEGCDTGVPTCTNNCDAGAAPKGGDGDDAKNCVQCSGDTPYADHDAHACVAECPPGSIGNAANDCAACPKETPFADHESHQCVEFCIGTGFAANSTSRDCEQCSGDTPYADENACVAECPSGYVGSISTDDNQLGSCKYCEMGEYADHHAHTCSTMAADCPTGSTANADDKNCDHTCSSNAKPDFDGAATSEDDETPVGCVAICPDGQAPDGAYKVCTSCVDGLFADATFAHKCVETCPQGTTQNDDTVNCDDDSVSGTPCYGNSAGKYCKAGCVSDEPKLTATCGNQCGAGTVPKGGDGDDHKNCEACEEGKYVDQDARACVEDCPSGTAPNAANDCAACPKETPFADHESHQCVETCIGTGFAGNSTSRDCERCSGDTPYANREAHACVAKCPSGSAPNATTNTTNDCAACPEETPFADHESHKCVETCGTGFAGNSTSKDCEQCNGDTPYANHEAHACVPECPSGHVGSISTDGNQLGSCNACEAGEYADHSQHTCSSADTDCPQGSTANADDKNCDHTCSGNASYTTLYFDGAPTSEDSDTPVGCVAICPDGQAPDGAYKVCTSCVDGTFADHGAHRCVETCEPRSQGGRGRFITIPNDETGNCDITSRTAAAPGNTLKDMANEIVKQEMMPKAPKDTNGTRNNTNNTNSS